MFTTEQLAALEQMIRHPEDFPLPPEYRIILGAILEKYPDESIRDLVWQHLWMEHRQLEKLDDAVRDALDVLVGWCNPKIAFDYSLAIRTLNEGLRRE